MIAIKNVYYMLSYAFKALNENGYKKVATEKFENTAELMASILAKGITVQIKRGLGKEYILQNEPLSTPRGKIDIAESIKKQTIRKKQLICSYDEFSVNSYMNQIIKSTAELLLRSNISKDRKKELKKLMVYFGEVDSINLYTVNWNLRYDRNNQTYRLLINICEMVVKGLLQTTSDGSTYIVDYLDDQKMCKLYEKFILEYYRKEYPKITSNASYIAWQLDDNSDKDLLPKMKTDATLIYKDKVLIIDAKFYKHATQVNYGNYTVHSGNLYQIFTYVKNKEVELALENQKKAESLLQTNEEAEKTLPTYEVAGMLLYAKTDEHVLPDHDYKMSGKTISVKTLDLNRDFNEIAEQLNEIVESYFGVEVRS